MAMAVALLLCIGISGRFLNGLAEDAKQEARQEAQSKRARFLAFMDTVRAEEGQRLRTYYRHLPARRPVDTVLLTSPFGPRLRPMPGASIYHEGVDMATAYGTPVRPPGAGRVVEVGEGPEYGMYVTIDHAPAPYRSRLAHLSEVLVSVGERVTRSDTVALSGSSGISTGPHLHFEIVGTNGPIDPARMYDHFLAVGDSLRSYEEFAYRVALEMGLLPPHRPTPGHHAPMAGVSGPVRR